MGAGTLLAKVDLEHAYQNIPIHRDDRLLLAMRWRRKLYWDTVLPGLRSGPKILPSYSHTVKLSYCHTALLSYCHIVILSHCHTVTLSYCLTVILSQCYTVILSHCLTVTLSYCLTVILSYCLTVILSYHHTVSYITISLHHSTITYNYTQE